MPRAQRTRKQRDRLALELGRPAVTALNRAFSHPYIKLDEAGTFDDLVLDELTKAFRRRYANAKTFRALARLIYIARITDGLDPTKIREQYGGG